MDRKPRLSYEEPKAGEWVHPCMKGYKLVCCDCGLVHILDFGVFTKGKKLKNGSYIVDNDNVKGHFAKFRVFRDNRATAAHRREKAKRDD